MVGKMKTTMLRRLMTFLPVLCLFTFCGGCGREDFVVYRVRAASFDDSRIGPVRKVVENVLPRRAKDILVEHYTGCLLGGASVGARCVVSQTDLLEFAAERKLVFQRDSTYINDNADMLSERIPPFRVDSDFLNGKIRAGKYKQKTNGKDMLVENYSDERPSCKVSEECCREISDVSKFWSYSFICPNNGGMRYFYDVERSVLYYDWSSN